MSVKYVWGFSFAMNNLLTNLRTSLVEGKHILCVTFLPVPSKHCGEAMYFSIPSTVSQALAYEVNIK